MQHLHTSARPSRVQVYSRVSVWWHVIGAAAVIVILLILLISALRREPTVITVAGPGRALPEAGSTPLANTSASTAASAAGPEANVPVIAVDTLPVAAKPAFPLEKGRGRLFITAGPGWCKVTVDGQLKGPTPLPALDLTPGAHQLILKRCATGTGSVRLPLGRLARRGRRQ